MSEQLPLIIITTVEVTSKHRVDKKKRFDGKKCFFKQFFGISCSKVTDDVQNAQFRHYWQMLKHYNN